MNLCFLIADGVRFMAVEEGSWIFQMGAFLHFSPLAIVLASTYFQVGGRAGGREGDGRLACPSRLFYLGHFGMFYACELVKRHIAWYTVAHCNQHLLRP